MTTDNYIIFGVGAYVSVLDDILCDIYKQRNKCYKIEGFIDSDINKINKSYYGYGVLGSISLTLSFVVVMGLRRVTMDFQMKDILPGRTWLLTLNAFVQYCLKHILW